MVSDGILIQFTVSNTAYTMGILLIVITIKDNTGQYSRRLRSEMIDYYLLVKYVG